MNAATLTQMAPMSLSHHVWSDENSPNLLVRMVWTLANRSNKVDSVFLCSNSPDVPPSRSKRLLHFQKETSGSAGGLREFDGT
jgi:hypothetical protein